MRTRQEMIDFLVEHKDEHTIYSKQELREQLEKLGEHVLTDMINNMKKSPPVG